MNKQILLQIENSSFLKEKKGKYSIQLQTIYGFLNVTIFISEIEISIHLNHNSGKEAYYIAAIDNLNNFDLDTFVNDSIKALFEEVANKYIARYSVQ